MKTSVMKLTEEQVNQIEGLVKQGYMDSEIARIFGNVSANAIYYWRKKFGIKTSFSYEKISKMDHDMLRELFDLGWSDYKIAKELGVSPCSVFNYRKNHGITRSDNLKYNKPIALTDYQKQVLIGIVMGDGCMRKTNVNPSFVCMHGIAQKDYCEYKREILSSLGSKIRFDKRKTIDRRTGLYYEDCAVSLPCNPELLEMYNAFYPQGKKVIPFSLFDSYTEVSLAFHYMDDGNKMKNGYAIATQSFSKEDIKRFVSFLDDRFGLKATIWKSGSIYINKGSKDLFKSLVEPYFCESMKYKL